MPAGRSLLLARWETGLELLTQLLGLIVLPIPLSRVRVLEWLSLIDLLSVVALAHALRLCSVIDFLSVGCQVVLLLVLREWQVISHEA